jgi:hypothetical protein
MKPTASTREQFLCVVLLLLLGLVVVLALCRPRETAPLHNTGAAGSDNTLWIWGSGCYAVVVVVWGDASGTFGLTGGYTICEDKPLPYGGRMPARNGGCFYWRGTVTLEGKGTICITPSMPAGQTADYPTRQYDLADGRLFVVTTTGKRIKVRQLQRDLSRLKPTAESVSGLAHTDPDVAALVASAGKPE